LKQKGKILSLPNFLIFARTEDFRDALDAQNGARRRVPTGLSYDEARGNF